jgi:hypothetical protein
MEQAAAGATVVTKLPLVIFIESHHCFRFSRKEKRKTCHYCVNRIKT